MYQLRNTLLGLRKSVRWKSSAGAVSLSPSFAVIYFNFLGQQLVYFKDSRRSLCICCSQARTFNTNLTKDGSRSLPVLA